LIPAFSTHLAVYLLYHNKYLAIMQDILKDYHFLVMSNCVIMSCLMKPFDFKGLQFPVAPNRVGARRNGFRPSNTTVHTVPYTAVQFVAVKWTFP